MAELAQALNGKLYSGDAELLDREALHAMVGGMTAEHVLERLSDGMVVIAPADRSDVLLALVNANVAQGFPRLAGMILNGGLKPHPMIDALVRGLNPTLPIIMCEQSTYETGRIVAHTRGRMANQSARKIEASLALMEHYIDGPALMAELDLAIPPVVTRRCSNTSWPPVPKPTAVIVLPGRSRAFCAPPPTGCFRGVARLTLLGDPEGRGAAGRSGPRTSPASTSSTRWTPS